MSDWIDSIITAWGGHRIFAEWLVLHTNSKVVVDLGVDYGFSTFVFSNSLIKTNGTVYGIDLFEGEGGGYSNAAVYENLMNNIKNNNLENVEIIVGDFTEISKTWNKKIDILHIDGFHSYEAVKNDFINWSKFVNEEGIVLFHDTDVQGFGVKDFFKELDGGYKLYFKHSYGLGIFTKNKHLYDVILQNFNNVYEFDKNPF